LSVVVPDECYNLLSVGVPDACYSGHASCALYVFITIDTFSGGLADFESTFVYDDVFRETISCLTLHILLHSLTRTLCLNLHASWP
jgi:hypothetical protein